MQKEVILLKHVLYEHTAHRKECVNRTLIVTRDHLMALSIAYLRVSSFSFSFWKRILLKLK